MSINRKNKTTLKKKTIQKKPIDFIENRVALGQNKDELELEKELDKKKSELLGIEYETEELEINTEENNLIEKPFDADKIRIDQQMLSLRYIVDLMSDGLVKSNPGFQRKAVWTERKRKSLLIESLCLRIPIPAFYFYENEDAIFQVIDGQQRLLTIQEFVNNEFKLGGLEYLGDTCNSKYFKDLDVKYQQRINRTQFAVNILDARSPRRVIYDIFRRINTGGVGLNPQEMRNAICEDNVREFLIRCTENKNYLQATRNKIKDIRLDSQEMVLRFFAFYDAYDYKNSKLIYGFSNLSEMLDEYMEKLNTMNTVELEYLYFSFNEAMSRVYRLFGEYCFSKIFLAENGNKIHRNLDYINKSLYSSLSTLILDPYFDNIKLEIYQENALIELAKALEDNEYLNSITIGTGDRRRLQSNFQNSMEVLKKCIKK